MIIVRVLRGIITGRPLIFGVLRHLWNKSVWVYRTGWKVHPGFLKKSYVYEIGIQ